ncbi:hypothetical protein BMR07_15325, partial [Methylococcaceae bacterium CS1]
EGESDRGTLMIFVGFHLTFINLLTVMDSRIHPFPTSSAYLDWIVFSVIRRVVNQTNLTAMKSLVSSELPKKINNHIKTFKIP